MFTWICQKCGSEVPPSETDCPNCRVKASQTVTAPPAQAPPAQPPHFQASQFQAPPPVQAPPVQTQPVQTQYVPPAPPTPPITPRPESLPAFAAAPPVTRKGMSPALVAAGSAVGILALLAVLYLYVLPSKTDTTAESPSAALESPAASGSAVATTTHPLAKYIEIAGIRIIEEGKGQVKIAYLVVNHSPANLPELQAQLSLGAAGKTIFEFPANIPSIGPYESKDLSASIKTRLQPYEMPDWQKLIPVVTITSAR